MAIYGRALSQLPSSDFIMCSPCRARGYRNPARRTVAGTDMCDACFNGEQTEVSRQGTFEVVPVEQTPFAKSFAWSELGRAVLAARDLPPGQVLRMPIGNRNRKSLTSNANEYAARAGIRITTRTDRRFLYIQCLPEGAKVKSTALMWTLIGRAVAEAAKSGASVRVPLDGQRAAALQSSAHRVARSAGLFLKTKSDSQAIYLRVYTTFDVEPPKKSAQRSQEASA